MEQYPDDDLLPISALQHLIFCPRQCALIYIEQVWAENLYTAEGRVLHDSVHDGVSESHKNIRTANGVRLVSHALGIFGQADVVEFHKAEGEYDRNGERIATRLPDITGLWKPYPVEYKRGRPKNHQADMVQLCAQAVCLEEMLKVYIPSGALFYGSTRRRQEVVFSMQLRELTEATAAKLHELIASGTTPSPRYDGRRCGRCSLLEICRPQDIERRSVARYIRRMIDVGDEKAA